MPAQQAKVWETAWLAVLLAFVGGSVDAIGYLVLFHMFTAHMSGNSVATGIHIGQHHWGEAFHRGFPIPMFVLGILIGAGLGEALARRGVRSTFAFALTLEALLLVLFIIFGSPVLQDGELARVPGWRFYLLAALPTVAIGLQNATLRRVGTTKVRTTYISGVLTNLSEQTVKYLFWLRDHWAGRSRLGELLKVSWRTSACKHMLLFLTVWLGYFAGAILGTLAQLNWELLALVIPLGCLAIVITCDLISPLARQSKDST